MFIFIYQLKGGWVLDHLQAGAKQAEVKHDHKQSPLQSCLQILLKKKTSQAT